MYTGSYGGQQFFLLHVSAAFALESALTIFCITKAYYVPSYHWTHFYF